MEEQQPQRQDEKSPEEKVLELLALNEEYQVQLQDSVGRSAFLRKEVMTLRQQLQQIMQQNQAMQGHINELQEKLNMREGSDNVSEPFELETTG